MQEDKRHHETDSSLIELRDLLADFATGELTGEQDARLQRLSIESETAWRLYLHYMFMYGTIHRKQCNRDKFQPSFAPSSNSSIFPLLEMENDLLSPSNGTDQFGASIASNPSDSNSGTFFGRINFSFVPGLIMIVATALILSGVVILPIYWSTRPNDPNWSVVARITKTIDCYWAHGKKWPREGALLTAGQLLDLELGLVEIEFISGTKVVVEGPAQFMVTGRNDSRLDLGQLAAIVPEGAEGFTVRTPGMDVVDLGTEFGVAVTAKESADIHVFKGFVEMETDAGKQKKIRLEKNEAVEFNKKSGVIIHIPINKKKFIRDLDRKDGIIANLRVTNASFELPDIRTVSEYQSEHGDTLFRPIYGWRVSDHNQARSQVVMYQISPYTSLVTDDYNVGPGATDGRQVATISLGVKPSSAGKPRSNWIYQSLGVITFADIGKTLKLSVDAGPRSEYGSFPKGDGTVYAGFALHVNSVQSGTVLGKPGSFYQAGEIKQLHRLEATVLITAELVGQKLFILLVASDNGSSRDMEQYFFDNVEVTVQQD